MKVHRILKIILSKTLQTIVKIFVWPKIFKEHLFKISRKLYNSKRTLLREKNPPKILCIFVRNREKLIFHREAPVSSLLQLIVSQPLLENLFFAFVQCLNIPYIASISAAER